MDIGKVPTRFEFQHLPTQQLFSLLGIAGVCSIVAKADTIRNQQIKSIYFCVSTKVCSAVTKTGCIWCQFKFSKFETSNAISYLFPSPQNRADLAHNNCTLSLDRVNSLVMPMILPTWPIYS